MGRLNVRKNSYFLMKSKLQIGITLVELLIVIAVIGILAAVILAALDPLDRIRASYDAKIQSDIAEIATRSELYAAKMGNYGNLATLVADGELKSIPPSPFSSMGYDCENYTETTYTMGNVTHYGYSCELLSRKYQISGTPYWVYCTSTGKAGPRDTESCN